MIRPGDRHLALAEASLAADPAIVRGVEFIEQFMSVNERCLLRELLRQAWLVGRQSMLLELARPVRRERWQFLRSVWRAVRAAVLPRR